MDLFSLMALVPDNNLKYKELSFNATPAWHLLYLLLSLLRGITLMTYSNVVSRCSDKDEMGQTVQAYQS